MRMWDLNSVPTTCQKNLSFPLKLPEKTPENQMARQDPGCRSPEESRDAKCAYSIEACAAERVAPSEGDDFEAKSVCETERKRKERAKGSPSVSSFSDLTCSIYNRQFRDWPNQPSKNTPTPMNSNTPLSKTKEWKWPFSAMRDERQREKGI